MLYNIHTVLEAVEVLSDQMPNVCLVLLHFSVNPHYMLELRRMISTRGMQHLVLWLPAQELPSDMARLYRMADVTVSIPSSEGYGSSVYEAMAAGCPTVVSDLPVFEDELRNRKHTLKVPVGDAESTGKALETLLTSQDLRHELISNAMRICQEKSVEERVSKSTALYQELAR
jgi:glycosyltransferase involved in cell wall biosynthesis